MSDFCVWLTGLPASGKTTLAFELEKVLKAGRFRPVVLDGDDLRQFLWPELRFSRDARKVQAERATYLAKLIQKAGGVPIVSLISPYREDRAWARQELKGFVEVFLDCPAAICALRDPKDLWARARRGEISQFTGVDDPYEEPLYPEVRVHTAYQSPGLCCSRVLAKLIELGYTRPQGRRGLEDCVDPSASSGSVGT